MSIDPHGALASLLASGSHPRTLWAGDGERLELSGRVTGTWSSKVANLLVEEGVAGPGARVALDLPLHWRTSVWALGTWLAGGCVVLVPPGARGNVDADLLVTTDPSVWQRFRAPVVATPLAAMALSWQGGSTTGLIDGAADVAAHADDLGPVPPFDPGAPALALGCQEVSFGAGLAPETSQWSSLARGLATVVATWAQGDLATIAP